MRWLSVVPALALTAWLLVGLPLLLAGHLTAAVTIPLAIVVAGALIGLVGTTRDISATSSTAGLLTVVVVAGFAALAWTTSSEHVVVRRDPGVYAQTAQWLADHGRLPVPARTDVFGTGPHLRYDSPGFFQRDGDVVPQFMSGTAIAMTPAGWAGGLRAITRADAVIGAFALLAVAGFVRRIAGAWAGLFAAVALGLVYPELQQARSAFSEPAAQLLLFGGLSLLVDAFRSNRRRYVTYAVAGLVIGLTALVRVDALAELVPLLPAGAVLAVHGRAREVVAAGLGVVCGVALGLVDGLALTRPYLDTLGHELRLTVAAAVGFALLAAVIVIAHRSGWVAAVLRLRSAAAAGAVLVVGGALLAYFVVPHLTHPRYAPDDPAGRDVVALQAHLGLPADGPRTYAEQSMHWLTWWLGPTGVALGVLGVAVLVHRVIRGRDIELVPFLLILLGTAVVVLARPSITPDHPWADRRFVPVVLPGLVAAAGWVIAHVRRWLRERTGRVVTTVIVVAAVLAGVAPVFAASYPLLGRSTERGELAAVRRVCAALPANAAVLVTGTRAREEWPQVIRSACGNPAVSVDDVDARATVRGAAATARGRGWQPVVLADSDAAVREVVDSAPRRVVHLFTREADHQLTKRPTRTRGVTIDVWTADVSVS